MKNEYKPRIDIVVPVYNAEAYLEECIESIEMQTYPNIHILIINDGSSDKSAQILQDIKEKHSNITIVSQENHGVGYARNRALSLLNGDYVSFVDADDTIAPDYIERLYKVSTEHNADISVASMYSEEPFSLLEYVTEAGLDTQNARKFFESNVIKNTLYYGVTNKLYKTKFLYETNASFDEELRFGEDLLFNMGLYLSSPTITLEKEARYIYRNNAQSITKKKNPNRCYDQFSVFVTMNDLYGDQLSNEPLLVAELFWMFTISGGALSEKEGANMNDLLNYYRYAMAYIKEIGYSSGILHKGAACWASIESPRIWGRAKLSLLTLLLITHSWNMLSIMLKWMGKVNANKEINL